MPVALLLLTLLTTTTLGAVWTVLVRTDTMTELAPLLTPATLFGVWREPALLKRGLLFALPALLILLVHELGHWIACRRHGLDATPPFFLPAPVGLGTFGAFIRIRSPIRSKRALLDVGVSGPIAGFVFLLPVLALGVAWSNPVRLLDAAQFGLPVLLYRPGNSLLLEILTRVSHGPLPAGMILDPHPFLLAGWVGLFATMLNLLPLAQLDGGHILYAVLGRSQRRVAWPLWFALVGLGFLWPGWWLWSVFVLVLGLRHPRIVDESESLDPRRKVLAGAALAIFVLGFMPAPVELLEIVPAADADRESVFAGRELQDQRDRAVVDQLDLHPGSKLAILHADTPTIERAAQLGDQRSGLLRARGAFEGRPAAARSRSEKSELRDQQDAPVHLGEREVHAAIRAVEDAQTGELLRGERDRPLVVPRLDSDQREQSSTDRANRLFAHHHPRSRYPL